MFRPDRFLFGGNSHSHSHHHHHHYHHHHRHHSGSYSLFGIPLGRLRPALYYFTLAVLITTFLYCFLSYQPIGRRLHHAHRLQHAFLLKNGDVDGNIGEDGNDDNEQSSYYHYHRRSPSMTLEIAVSLLDTFICNANEHYAEHYHRKIPLVPHQYDPFVMSTTNQHDLFVVSDASSSLQQRNILSDSYRYEVISNPSATTANTKPTGDSSSNTHTRQPNRLDDSVSIQSIQLIGQQNAQQLSMINQQLATEMPISKYENDELEDALALLFDDSDSVEYNLEHLGFNLRHITRYLWHKNQTNSTAAATTTTTTITSNIDKLPRKSVVQGVSNSATIAASKSATLNNDLKNKPENFSTPIDLIKFYSSVASDQQNRILLIVTAIDSDQYSIGYEFIQSFVCFRQLLLLRNRNKQQLHFRLIIYDLGLSIDQHYVIETLCNNTVSRSSSFSFSRLCSLRSFQFDNYASHLSNHKYGAYRSIIIQELLRDSRQAKQIILARSQSQHEHNTKHNMHDQEESIYNLLWLDPHYRFLNSNKHLDHLSLDELLTETRTISGLRSWPIEQPTSSLTHPRMFDYFHTTADNFYFHRMVRASHLIISIGDSTWQQFEWGVMLPWVRCALTEDCIAPLGSQWRSSCRFDRKPHYRYSGCHHYDMSALNVVLGIAFNYSSSPQYSASCGSRFFAPFHKLIPSSTDSEPTTSNDNATSIDDTSGGGGGGGKKSGSDETYNQLGYDYDQYNPQASSPSPLLAELSELPVSENRFDRLVTDDELPIERRLPLPTGRPITSDSLSDDSGPALSSDGTAGDYHSQHYYHSLTGRDDGGGGKRI